MRIAINGFGRIGRIVYRVLHRSHPEVEVVAINDITSPDVLAHLLRYDSVHGRFEGQVSAAENGLLVNKKHIAITAEKDPSKLPHKANKIDFVIEATGIFETRDKCQQHIDAGAKRVLLTVPPKDAVDAMIVLGVNENTLKREHKIISNASCTTNCLAPLAKVLHEAFGVRHGLMSTTHAYTNDQRVLDLPHKDLRRARAAAINIIPTTTGAARAVGKVLPALAGKLDGMALRVPVPDGSVVDLVAVVEKDATVESVNAAYAAAAKKLTGILEYSTDPLVSSDIVGNPHSTVFDSLATMVIDKRLVKLVAWYDNEWAYSNRVVELMLRAHALDG